VFAGSPLIFVLENSHFGHLKVSFSAPLALGSLPANSMRVRHIAQRGGLTVSGDGAASLSEDGIISLEAAGAPCTRHVCRHCEERSDEAIQLPSLQSKLDCFAEPVTGRAFARPVGSQLCKFTNSLIKRG
jgi:hypothetical protein